MNKRYESVVEILREQNPDALLADGFEDALVGVADRFGIEPVALYDRGRCLRILMDRDGLSSEDAFEHMSYNVEGAWVGEGTPIFCDLADNLAD